jgi:nicotinamide-nucleotide amidase
MYENEVRPLLAQNIGGELRPPLKKTIKTFGLGESQVEQLLAGLKKTTGQWIAGLRAVDGEIHIKLQFDNENGQNEGAMENLTGNIRDLLGHAVFGCDEETLTGKVAELLLDSGKTVALAESCTGGLMAKSITDLPGSSRYFWGGVNSYSNQAKMLFLGVKEETLARFGAVSKETAEEMARGILDCSGADFGLSVTGIAGPDGGTKDKSVGLVYIALAERNGCRVRELRLSGGRDFIRILSAKSAWDLLRRYLLSAQ